MSALRRMMTLAAEALQAAPHLLEAAEQSSTLEELRADAKKVTIDGRTMYVLEGDLVYDEDELMLHALQKETQQQAKLIGISPPGDLGGATALVAVSRQGKVVRWKPGLVLRYCVLRKSFMSQVQYELVTANMVEATNAWTSICGIEFQHMPEHDEHDDVSASPDTIASDLIFTVRFIDAQGAFIASAFFPTYPPARRRVLIDPSYFKDTLRFDRVGVLRHELGHVLGFRHEHIRSEAPAECPDEDKVDTSMLTKYDPQSVMHYFCGGIGSPTLAITAVDREGAQKVYGPPFVSMDIVE